MLRHFLGHKRSVGVLLFGATIGAAVVTFALPGADATSDRSGTVRIVAQRLEDGRVEFGLQPQDGSSWGERILPSPRFFPVNARVNRWLSSGPIELGATTGEFVPSEENFWEFDAELTWSAQRQGGEFSAPAAVDRLWTTVDAKGSLLRTANPRLDGLRLSMRCLEARAEDDIAHFIPAEFQADIAFFIHGPHGYPVSLKVDPLGRRLDDGSWSSNAPAIFLRAATWVDDELVSREWWVDSLEFDLEFMHTIRHYELLYVSVRGELDDGSFELFDGVFDNLQEIFGTPLQENLNRCGLY